jgi:myo-inositol catabolism protein IolC
MEKIEIKKMVLEIVDSLYNRGGFDDWWSNLDNDIEEEIIKEIEDIIEKRIDKYNCEKKLLSNK